MLQGPNKASNGGPSRGSGPQSEAQGEEPELHDHAQDRKLWPNQRQKVSAGIEVNLVELFSHNQCDQIG